MTVKIDLKIMLGKISSVDILVKVHKDTFEEINHNFVIAEDKIHRQPAK